MAYPVRTRGTSSVSRLLRESGLPDTDALGCGDDSQQDAFGNDVASEPDNGIGLGSGAEPGAGVAAGEAAGVAAAAGDETGDDGNDAAGDELKATLAADAGSVFAASGSTMCTASECETLPADTTLVGTSVGPGETVDPGKLVGPGGTYAALLESGVPSDMFE